jgi:hypothetical protein
MRVIKTIKPQLAGWRQGGKFTLKRDIPLPAFMEKINEKVSRFFISCKLQEINSYMNIKGAIFFDEKNRRSIAQAFFLALGSTAYCYVNDMETKENEGIDVGILFDIVAKRTILFEEEKISKRNDKF